MSLAILLALQERVASTGAPIRIEQVLTPLAAALALSLVVERVVELLKNVVDILPTTAAGRAMQKPAMVNDAATAMDKLFKVSDEQRAAEDKIEVLERKLVAAEAQREKAADAEARARIDAEIKECKDGLRAAKRVGEWEEIHRPETILVEPATDPDDGTTLRTFIIQTLALVVGIVAAHYTKLHLFAALAPGAHVPPQWDYILTGLFIGGGSAPAHALIEFITERKIAVAEVPERAEVPVPVAGKAAEVTAVVAAPAALVAVKAYASASSADPDRWLDIPYSGGVDVDLLETIHRRRADPDLVVFHHTAMPLKSTFDDVVRVIKSRTDDGKNNWVTGYNCVVLADGSIHPFCRWDRYGNHAQGYNARSLGVSLNGNFETDPRVPFSNPDGRYGPSRPTEAQLDSAARVVALWAHLYPAIALDFSRRTEGIIPHKNVSPKTCPGNMFPYAQFEKLVRHYHDVFGRSAECKARITSFRLRPLLFVDPMNPPGARKTVAAAVPQPVVSAPRLPEPAPVQPARG